MNKKKIKLKILIISSGIFLLVVFLSVLLWVYFSGSANARAFSEKLHLPAIVIGYGNFISTTEIADNLQSVRNFYENQDFSKIGYRIDFSTSKGKKNLKLKEKEVINKMIEDEIIKILAKKEGIRITKKIVDQNVSRKLAEYETQETVKNNLKKQYGWTLEDFKEKVVTPSMYSEILKKKVEKNLEDDNIENRKIIEKAKNELDEGKNFADVVKKYSEGSTNQEDGDLGWFKKDQLNKKIAEDIFMLKNGEISDILESELGYHIIKLNDKKKENGDMLVNLSQIFVSKVTFVDWLEKEMKDINIFVPIKEYEWNNNALSLEFVDEEMKKFEKENAILGTEQ